MKDGYLATFAQTIVDSVQTVWGGLLAHLPNVLGALIILLIGWALAAAAGKLVRHLVELTKIDDVIDSAGLDKNLEEAGIDFSLAKLFGWLAKWFIIVVTLIAVADLLKLDQITDFLQTIALYIPNIIIAVVILLVGIVLGNFAYKVVSKGVDASKLSAASGVLASIAKWSIFVFALLAALNQLNIAKELINTLFTGLVGMLALAGGLAFGLGGKDHAKELLEKLKREMQ